MIELGVVLTAARRFTQVCLNVSESPQSDDGGTEIEGNRLHFIGSLVEMISLLTRDVMMSLSREKADDPGVRSTEQTQSLQAILGI